MKKTISQTENPTTPPPQRQPNPTHRILVVENDADTRRLTHENLLGKARDVLRATAIAREEAAPSSHWQIQPLADRFQL